MHLGRIQCRRVPYPCVTTWECRLHMYSMCQTYSTALHKAHGCFGWSVRPDPCHCHAVPCRAVPSNEGVSLSNSKADLFRERAQSIARREAWVVATAPPAAPAPAGPIPTSRVTATRYQASIPVLQINQSFVFGIWLPAANPQVINIWEGFIQQPVHLGCNVRPQNISVSPGWMVYVGPISSLS